MAAAQTAPGGSPLGGGTTFGRKQARRSSAWLYGGAAVGLGLIALFLWPSQEISQRPHDMKTTTVILPPPPPPPPPPPKEQVEQPPEPTIAPPIEQPLDTPPPPDQASDPTPGDNALTAREGAGPSNYGLQSGDGSGTRIGTRPGGSGDAFRAYAGIAQRCVQRAVQGDRELARGRYAMQVAVTFASDGRITSARPTTGDDERRNARVREILTGLQCSPPPPPGLPVMRLDLNARSGG